jgi:hypothetical protein
MFDWDFNLKISRRTSIKSRKIESEDIKIHLTLRNLSEISIGGFLIITLVAFLSDFFGKSLRIFTEFFLLRWIVMLRIETPGVLNGHLVFPDHVMMDIKNIGCDYHPRRLVPKFQVL